MNLDQLCHPHRQEEVGVEVNGVDHGEVTYTEWCELLESVNTGEVTYSTWCQEDGELQVLCHEYNIVDGVVVSYDQSVDTF